LRSCCQEDCRRNDEPACSARGFRKHLRC
jgi:hypothetical protein